MKRQPNTATGWKCLHSNNSTSLNPFILLDVSFFFLQRFWRCMFNVHIAAAQATGRFFVTGCDEDIENGLRNVKAGGRRKERVRERPRKVWVRTVKRRFTAEGWKRLRKMRKNSEKSKWVRQRPPFVRRQKYEKLPRFSMWTSKKRSPNTLESVLVCCWSFVSFSCELLLVLCVRAPHESHSRLLDAELYYAVTFSQIRWK